MHADYVNLMRTGYSWTEIINLTWNDDQKEAYGMSREMTGMKHRFICSKAAPKAGEGKGCTDWREVGILAINMLFFTIIIKRQELTKEQYLHNEQVSRLYEEHKDRVIQHRLF